MSQKQAKKISQSKRIISIVLFALSIILLIVSVSGFFVRSMESTKVQLNEMRTNAVLHVASGGLVDKIAAEAKNVKLKELRALPDFRKMGLNEVEQLCADAEAAARSEAEAIYSNVGDVDTAALAEKIDALELAMADYSALEATEQAEYANL